VFRGVNSLGSIVYWTMGIPIGAIAILLVRGVTLEKASRGIYYFVGVFRGEELANPQANHLWRNPTRGLRGSYHHYGTKSCIVRGL
jgi:hypothetical protein